MCGDITGRINRSNNRVRMSSYVQTAGPVTSTIVERRDNLLIEIFTLMAARPSHKRGNLQSLNFRPSQTDEPGRFANDQDRSQRDPSIPCKFSGSRSHRLAQTRQRNKMARAGNGGGCNARRPARDDLKTRGLLGQRPRLAQVRGETEGPAAFHHRDRRAGHSFHSRSFEA